MLYENLHRISVSEGVLISTATLENCFIPISRLIHFGIEKMYSSSSQKSTMTASPSLPPLWCSLSRSYPKVFMQRHGQYVEICRLWYVFPAKTRWRWGKSVQLPFQITVNWFLLILQESVPFEHAIVNTLKMSKDQFTRSPNQSRRGDATCHMWGRGGNSAK